MVNAPVQVPSELWRYEPRFAAAVSTLTMDELQRAKTTTEVYAIAAAKVQPTKKTQEQLYEENRNGALTIAEWAVLWGVPAERVPLKLGEEEAKYAKKHPYTATVTPAPAPTPQISGLGWLALIGLGYLVLRGRK